MESALVHLPTAPASLRVLTSCCTQGFPATLGSPIKVTERSIKKALNSYLRPLSEAQGNYQEPGGRGEAANC